MNDIGMFDEDGLWISENIDGFQNWLQHNHDKRTVMKLAKWYKQRTKPENAYYWACIVEPLSNEFGYTKTEMHESLKSIFLKIEIPGKPPKILSTTELTTLEAEKYYEEIRIWASSEYKIRLMLPNEYVE
jgi:hypothetical protein